MEHSRNDDFVQFCFFTADLTDMVIVAFGLVDGTEVAIEDGFVEDFCEDKVEVI